MTSEQLALCAEQVYHRYGKHQALNGLSLRVPAGEIFAVLGPNGSGKSTLFRLIATLVPVQSGAISVFGHSVSGSRSFVRGMLGVVFQAASLDPKLTVEENIRCQGTLYGMSGRNLSERTEEVLDQLGIQDRRSSPTQELSGGLKRRVELAKCILHRPPLLLMDEPSTGLDPAARLDMWHALKALQHGSGVSVLLTTHLLEEAEKADQLAIIDQGVTVACGTPSELRSTLGGQLLSIQSKDAPVVKQWLSGQGVEHQEVEQQIRVVDAQAANLVAPLASEFGDRIQSITLGQPSLEDVFVAKTGHQFWNASDESVVKKIKK